MNSAEQLSDLFSVALVMPKALFSLLFYFVLLDFVPRNVKISVLGLRYVKDDLIKGAHFINPENKTHHAEGIWSPFPQDGSLFKAAAHLPDLRMRGLPQPLSRTPSVPGPELSLLHLMS